MSDQRVVELWRYPVKSMGGERLPVADVDQWGIAGDRQWAVVDLDTGLALTAKREPRLLFAVARVVDRDGTPSVAVTLPDGTTATAAAEAAEASAALTAWLGRPVELRRANPDVAATYEIAADFEAEDTSPLFHWSGPEGTFHDSTKTRVSIAALGEMRNWAAPRFRANVLLSGATSRSFVGHTLAAGGVQLDVGKHIGRCVMVTRPQPGPIERDLDVLRTINAQMSGELGVGAMVRRSGRMAVGDLVEVVAGGDIGNSNGDGDGDGD